MIRLAGLIATLVAVLAATPAPAQQPAPAPVANPAFDAAKTAADGLGPDRVAAIQRSLIWTGDLNTLASGDFGKRSFDAIRAFQRRIKAPDDGILTPPQRAALDKAAKAAAAGFGMTPVASGGVSLAYPAKLAAGRSEGRFGPKFSAPDGSVTVDILRYPVATETADALFERLKAERPGRTVSYSLSRPDAFVITGTVDGKAFYIRFLKLSDATAGFVLGWDPKLSPGIDRLAIAMAVSLAPEGAQSPQATASASPPPAAPAAAAPAPPQGRIAIPLAPGAPTTPRTGSGILVGDRALLVPAALVAGCATVTLAKGGSAPVVAGDAAAGIALIRLPEARPAGLALREAPLDADEALRLVAAEGEATPAPVKVAALSGPGDDTRRVMLDGAYGTGALIDSGGALAGFAGTADKSALKPLFLAAFLRAQGVAAAPSGGAAPVRVGVNCVPSR